MAHRLKETGLSSNAAPALPGFRAILTAAALLLATPLAAQSDSGVTPPPAPAPPAAEPQERPRINVLVTVPRGEVNQAQAQECEDRADAGTISGEIVVCRNVGDDTSALTGNREATQKRYAQETMLKGAPRAPEAFGIPNHGNPIGFGKAPPPAYIVDFQALPTAPAGSDADRIARGLAPLGKDGELSEEEEKARREAAGIKTTVPAAPKKKR
jgi:hypothetical protein